MESFADDVGFVPPHKLESRGLLGFGATPTHPPHSEIWVDSINIKKNSAANIISDGSETNSKSVSDCYSSKKSLKKRDFKPPKVKPNAKWPQYDVSKFPWSDILDKVDRNDQSLPTNFEANGPVRRVEINEDTEMSRDTKGIFDKDGVKSDFWKFCGMFRLNPGNALAPVLGKLLQYREDLIRGTDYVYHSRKEKHFDRDQMVHYFFFTHIQAALLGAYLIGAEGDELCPLTALSKWNVAFNEMFTYKNGQIDQLLVTYHDEKWFRGLRKILEEMKSDAAELTCGRLRHDLAKLRYDIRKEAVGKGKVCLDIQQTFLDDYYPNKLNSLHIKARGLFPRGAPRRVWQAAYDNKEVLMVNSLNNVIKYFKNYDFKEAEKEVTAHKELNTHSKNGLSDRAKQIKKIDRAKTADELRRIQMDNNFLRTNAKEYRLHPRFNLLFGVDKSLLGTMNDAALREWRLNAEKDKQAVNILNIKKQYSLEEWSLAQQLFVAGSRANPELVKFLYSLKGHHDKQYRKNAREIAFVAAYAAATRNELRHVTETTKLEIESIKTNLEVIRHTQGMEPIYNIDAAQLTDERVKKIEKQVDARNEMVYDRDGEFPLVDTGKQIIEGNGEIVNYINTSNNHNSNDHFFTLKGTHFRKTDGGFNDEDLDERDINSSSFLDTKNFAYTESENKLIAQENGEPRAKIRKECDKLSHKGLEIGRGCESICDASFKIENENIMECSDSQNSICRAEIAVVKKPNTKRIQDRAKQIMKNINDKISHEIAGGKNYPLKHINIGDNELALIQFKKEDFEEISSRPYISLTGEVLISLSTHKWPKKGKKPDETMMHQRISLQEMQRTWFSVALLYSRGVRAILGAIMEINLKRTTARLNHSTIMECADLKNDLEIFESGLSDSNWAQMFATREDKGRAFCPLPTLILYNTIMNYLPVIKSRFGDG